MHVPDGWEGGLGGGGGSGKNEVAAVVTKRAVIKMANARECDRMRARSADGDGLKRVTVTRRGDCNSFIRRGLAVWDSQFWVQCMY